MRIRLLFLTILFLLTVKTVSAATIKINEFYAAGTTTSNPDWVEIYNDGADISHYQIMDAANNKKDLAAATCNGNFCTVEWYNYLNNSGDTLKLVLKTAIDSSLDQVIYGTSGDVSVPGVGQSAQRNPDITGNWIISSLPTKGGPNNSSTPMPTQTSTPTSLPTSTPTSSFTISNIPSQVNSDQSFTTSVSLSIPNNPNANFYLKGAFKKADSSNYFGLTKVSGNWIKNGSSFSNQHPVTTDSSGYWSGDLEVKPDSEDSGFTGEGDYIFKVGRYTSSGSGPTWSNESTIKIISLGGNQEESPANSKTPSQGSSVTNAKTTKTGSNPSKSNETLIYNIASVAAATASATESSTTSTETGVKNQKQTNLFIWAGLIFIFTGGGSLGYIYLKKNGKIPFKL